MPLLHNVGLCALAALLLSTSIGLPLTRQLFPGRALAGALAPVAGWATFSTLALPILIGLGFSRPATALLFGIGILIGAGMLWRSRVPTPPRGGDPTVPLWAFLAAALLAILPALSTWPKLANGGLVLAESMFDHSKIAMIDDMVRMGLPPGNPFFGEVGHGDGLSYYYLWHFSAAFFARLTRANGWEADIALTWFTAYSTLALMMGLATWISRSRAAAPLALLLGFAGSLRPVLAFVLPAGFLDGALSSYQPMKNWMFQADWVPQHLASASCVVLALLLIARLAEVPSWKSVPLLAILVAAGFESSAWIGGIIFAGAAAASVFWLLLHAPDNRTRITFMSRLAVAALLMTAISFPFLRGEFAATAARQVGFPIAFAPFPVLGPMLPEGIRRALDLAAYWLVLLVIEFPAIYPAGIATMLAALAKGTSSDNDRPSRAVLVLLCFASLAIPWLFRSIIANNDLAWRGVLPGIFVLTGFAAAGLLRWTRKTPAAALAPLVLLVLALPDGLLIAREDAVGTPMPSAAALAQSPALWAAVRRYAGPGERIGNNPAFLRDAVRWPVNMSWALFADRRSCYANWELARAYVALPQVEIDRVDALFKRVFAGKAAEGDVQALAARYDCRVVVVVPSDGAWDRDPFADGRYYRLAEERAARWRIYRVLDRP